MLNFSQIVFTAARAAGDKPILAAPYPMSPVLCRELVSKGVISGYVAEATPDPKELDPLVAGWWTDRSARSCFLRTARSSTMLMLSAAPSEQLSGDLLLEARFKGVRRVLYVDAEGTIVKEVDVATSLSRLIRSVEIASPIHRLTYDCLYEDLYEGLTSGLRLPPSAFIPGRILILIGNLQGGGAERQAVNTAIGLARRCPGQVFVGRRYEGGAADFYKPLLEGSGVRLCMVPPSSEQFNSPELVELRSRFAARFANLGGPDILYMIFHHALLIREIGPEIVHCWLDYSNILGGIAADLVGVPRLVLSGRSLAPDNFTIFQPCMAPGYRAIFSRRKVTLLNNSEAGAADYARWLQLPLGSFNVIRNGFDIPELQADARSQVRSQLGIANDAVVVGTIIGFREEKRPQLWIEMAKCLHRDHPKLQFVIFGDGPLRDSCREQILSAGLHDVFSLPGTTTNVWAALAAMDVFVLTSRMEGLPNVMIEAQFVGVPVICTGTGGMYETFAEGESGFGIRDATPEMLAKTVGRLVEDPELRRRMGENGRARAHKEYSMDRMIDRTLEAYGSTSAVAGPPLPDWQEPLSTTNLRLAGIIKHDEGSFVAELPQGFDVSELCVWEDDFCLTAADPDHPVGVDRPGAYRFVDSKVYFSASNGSDPRFNGRTYWLRLAHQAFDEVQIDSGAIRQEAGHCFTVHLGLGEGGVHFRLWEDQTRLGPGSCLHDEIRLRGQGRYSVWGDDLYLSSSDNSNPRTNGRRYFLRREPIIKTVDQYALAQNDMPLEQAVRQMLRGVTARPDFVPGRIVHIGGSLGPGGAERQIVYTMIGLRDRPIESAQLLCYYIGATSTDRYDFYLPTLEEAGVPVRSVRRHVGEIDPNTLPPSLRLLGKIMPQDLLGDVADLYWEFIDLKPEVVHAWLDGNLERAGLAAALAGVPRIILSGRNISPPHFSYYRDYMRPIYRELLKFDQVTMINNCLVGRDDYADWLGIEANRISVIYNGIDFPKYSRPGRDARAALRIELGLDPEAFVVGGVFRFAPEKNPRLWIETAVALAAKLPEAQFILFGKGELQTEMEEMATEFGLRDRLILAGLTDNILNSIAAMDVLMLSSRFEGLPNVVLEAQWVGTPVVATPAGGTPEAVEEGVTGWIVEPNPAALAEQLAYLHGNPAARLRVQVRGPSFVKEKFAVPRMIEETMALYRISQPAQQEAA